MKKLLSVLFASALVLSLISCASTPAAPSWLDNSEEDFPESQYISGIGTGSTAADAKAQALAELSRYISTSIKSTLTTEFSGIDSGDGIDVTNKVLDQTQLSTSLTMSGLKYTDAYKDKSGYTVLAYIQRDEAWKQLNETLKLYKGNFYSYYNNAEGKDPLNKYFWYSKAYQYSPDFLEKLLLGNFISPEQERAAYGEDHKVIENLPGLMSKCLKESTLYISLTNDSENIISTELGKVLKSLGFAISKTQSGAAYVVYGDIDLNVEGSDLKAAYPSIELNINYGDDTLYSYSAKVDEKTVSYDDAKLARTSLKKLAAIIDSELSSDFSSKVGK